MDGVAMLLRFVDDAWSHSYESVASALEGVSEEEACWQADCYADEPQEAGWPQPGTILWQVLHLAHCKRHYALYIQQRGQAKGPQAPEFQPHQDLQSARTALAQAHGALRAALAQVKVAELDCKAGNSMVLPEFVSMIQRHDAWHAGQIALVRRLFRKRSGARAPGA